MSHNIKDTIVIDEYKRHVDEEVLTFTNSVINNERTKKYVIVAEISEKMASDVFDLTGKQIEGNSVLLDVNAVRHIIKRHGVEGKQDNSMSDPSDIARIGYVLDNYDDIAFDGRLTPGYTDESQQPSPLITIRKRINGTYYVINATGSATNRKSYIVSAYITKA